MQSRGGGQNSRQNEVLEGRDCGVEALNNQNYKDGHVSKIKPSIDTWPICNVGWAENEAEASIPSLQHSMGYNF